jgi:2-isopropylmalate synthase
MRPEDVGVTATTLVLGKHSGRHAVQKRCEQMGVALSRFEIDRVYRQMVALADAHKHVSDAQLRAIVDEVRASEAAGIQASAPAVSHPAASAPLAEPPAQAHEVGYGHGV